MKKLNIDDPKKERFIVSKAELMHLYRKNNRKFEVQFHTPKGIIVDFIKEAAM